MEMEASAWRSSSPHAKCAPGFDTAGSVVVAELWALQDLEVTSSIKETWKLWSLMDLNGDGELSTTEFEVCAKSEAARARSSLCHQSCVPVFLYQGQSSCTDGTGPKADLVTQLPNN